MEYKNNQNEEQMVKDIANGIVKLGFGYIPSENEKEEIDKRRKKHNKIEKIKRSFLDTVRTIIYTPLAIAFHGISFIARGIGYISSFGLILGAYYLYQSFSDFMNGVAISEIDTIKKAFVLIIFPFIAYSISIIAEKLYHYFDDNSF